MKRAQREWLAGIGMIAVAILAVGPAWLDGIVAVAAACGWCYALDCRDREVTR